jgi:hypothetical protein
LVPRSARERLLPLLLIGYRGAAPLHGAFGSLHQFKGPVLSGYSPGVEHTSHQEEHRPADDHPLGAHDYAAALLVLLLGMVPMEMSPQQMQSMGMMKPEQLANSKPFDRAFVDAMIPHPQSTIEIARVASKKSKNPEIEELAENIVSTQKREIETMKQWRREWYPKG